MKVLVTGAAGYVGSHAVRALGLAGHAVIALDNLSRGHRAAVPDHVPFVEADVRDRERVDRVLHSEHIDCVMHFAAFAAVGESVENPLIYYDNNTFGTLCLLQALEHSECRRFVFSSTCATYGEPDLLPIREETAQNPIHAYGASKLFSERMLRDLSRKLPNLSCAMLRYFNVAGAADDGSLGEHHEPETHLIPVLLQTALGVRNKAMLFGDDYPTPDGTCIRDYIHVEDLVEAHVAVMEALRPGDLRVYNLGIGKGYSVKQVVDATRAVVKRPIQVQIGPRRPGDPPSLYADATLIHREIGWKAKRTELAGIIESAWKWYESHPSGYLD